MLKTSLSALALIALFAATPASAQADKIDDDKNKNKIIECTQEKVTKFQERVDRMVDATKKEAATKEMTLAKEMMAKPDLPACVTHLTAARKIFKGL